MRFMISKSQLTILLAAFAVVALLATTAQATVHPISGNARFQIGDGLPIPIGLSCPTCPPFGIQFFGAPNGAVPVKPGAMIIQAPGPDPRQLVMEKKTFEHIKAPLNIPVFGSNKNVFQVNTSIGIEVPLVDEFLSAGRRTGHTTVNYCPGQVVTPSGDPMCLSGSAATGNVKGIMIYQATGNQFGGPMGGRVFGTANVAINPGLAAAGPPFNAVAMSMALASPVSTGTGGIGNIFGGMGSSVGKVTTPGVFTITATGAGRITAVTPTSAGNPGPINPANSYGAPWTTGKVTVTAPSAVPPEKFILSGSDMRVSGVGTISLVAGGLSNRLLTGPNANRGWLNMTIGAPVGALPSMSSPGIAALVGLMSLAGGYAMRQRNRK